MAQEFRKGDRVTWDAGNQSSVGTIEEKVTSDTEAGGRKVKASTDDPQYLVRSEKHKAVDAAPQSLAHGCARVHPGERHSPRSIRPSRRLLRRTRSGRSTRLSQGRSVIEDSLASLGITDSVEIEDQVLESVGQTIHPAAGQGPL